MLYLLVVSPIGVTGAWLHSPNFKSSLFYAADYPYVAVPLGFNIFLYIFSALTLAALTYFCAFVLSLSAEYEKANAEKIRSERFKAELITNVSHDIRTPLTSIINYVDLLKALPIEREDFSEYVSVLDKKSARLKSLINGLMEASKAATGNIAVNMREIDLAEIVGQIAGEFDDQFAERELTFVFRRPGCAGGQSGCGAEEFRLRGTTGAAQRAASSAGVAGKQILQSSERSTDYFDADESVGRVTVNADSDLLWRVLENLFGNAVKYALPGTRIFAEIVLHDGKTILSLKNTSQNPIDMPADALTEQFIRGDRARQTDGNGLGLYIAKSLVELMGGRFTIRVTGDLFETEVLL